MKLNDRTLSVMKNFASINSGVVIRKGIVQRTISPEQTILVEAHFEDDFPETFGIYDLNQFLGNITTLNNPDLTFTSEVVKMNDGEIELSYHACSTNLIISPPEGKDLVMKNPDLSFSLSQSSLNKILKIGAMNNLPNISIVGDKNGLYVKSHELKNDTSNFANMRISDHNGEDFTVTFKTENLRLIPDNYNIDIKIGGFSCWTNSNNTLKYFIAMEKGNK
jgi:hypothetical protein